MAATRRAPLFQKDVASYSAEPFNFTVARRHGLFCDICYRALESAELLVLFEMGDQHANAVGIL